MLNAYQEFRKKFEPVIRNVHPTYLKLEDAIYTKKTELEELKKRKDAVEKEQKKQKSAKVVVTGNLYSGVSVEINGVIWRSILEDKYTILEAENGKQALEIVDKEAKNMAAILLELVMPEMDGTQVLEEPADHRDAWYGCRVSKHREWRTYPACKGIYPDSC